MILVKKLSSSAFKVTTVENENIITFLEHKNAYYIKDLYSTFTQVAEELYLIAVELFNDMVVRCSNSVIRRAYDEFITHLHTLENISVQASNKLIDIYNQKTA